MRMSSNWPLKYVLPVETPLLLRIDFAPKSRSFTAPLRAGLAGDTGLEDAVDVDLHQAGG